ncbi:YqaA family protein [Schleiferia thermophila]|uniref:Membrane protein YqaA with SNARE-associated domain n=1 Tax=Schleiferia thermophila TaxID=884107 RepID=A0A369A3R5_9FLAO|nr:VTT domain-containing protein [Schleiferia thermophila]RCX03801.1 membrane protein YqaA with SNARE-associated domain [Schleiferia thermophila]
MEKKNRSFGKYLEILHYANRKRGVYSFLGKNLWKLLLTIAVFMVIFWVLTHYVFDFNHFVCTHLTKYPAWLIMGFLFLSECFTGILSPDIFIVWAKSFEYPYRIVFILASLSYIGGIISYSYGRLFYRIKVVRYWIDDKFKEQFDLLKKFGGILIVTSALAPLPFSPVSVVTGAIKYPFKKYVLLASTRYLRFYGYAWFLYMVVKNSGPC